MNVDYSNIKNNGFIVQGFTVIDGKTFISAYRLGYNSRIYVYDKKSCIGKIILNNRHHVGGITYDKKNCIIFITGKNGSITSLDYKKIKYKMKKDFIIKISDEDIIENNINVGKQVSTIYYFKNHLYTSLFKSKSLIFKTNYKYKDGIIYETKTDCCKLKNINATQGLAIKKNYLFVSSSFGKLPSRLNVYSDNRLITSVFYKHKGLEGIYFINNDLYGVFEFGKQKVIKLGDYDKLISVKKRYFYNMLYSFVFRVSYMLKLLWWKYEKIKTKKKV